MRTPVLFLIYKRPETTARVFEQIRKAKPRQLFVVADGPKDKPGEREACEEARCIATQVDWDCELKTNFSDCNMGCRNRVSSGITWFFEHVEEGIILEDDCLPSQSMFYFCSNLLNRYKHDLRVFHISGFNPITIAQRKESYIFSKHGSVWGWATWADRWKTFEKVSNANSKHIHGIATHYRDHLQAQYRIDVTQRTLNGSIDSWAYLWTYTKLLHNGLSIVPVSSLIRNIGNDRSSTNHPESKHILFNVSHNEINEISHPDFFLVDQEYDDREFYETRPYGYLLPHKSLLTRAINKLGEKLKNL